MYVHKRPHIKDHLGLKIYWAGLIKINIFNIRVMVILLRSWFILIVCHFKTLIGIYFANLLLYVLVLKCNSKSLNCQLICDTTVQYLDILLLNVSPFHLQFINAFYLDLHCSNGEKCQVWFHPKVSYASHKKTTRVTVFFWGVGTLATSYILYVVLVWSSK